MSFQRVGWPIRAVLASSYGVAIVNFQAPVRTGSRTQAPHAMVRLSHEIPCQTASESRGFVPRNSRVDAARTG